MQLFHLYYFKIVAETENYRKASELLNISQPALSKAISNLEAEMGVSLFDRSKRRIRLSSVGAEYYKYIARAFESIEAGDRYVQSLKNTAGNKITIGTTSSELLLPLIRAYMQEYPDSRLEINQYLYEPEVLKEQLRKGGVDFVLTPLPMTTDEVEQLRLMDEEVLLMAAQSHPMAKELFVRLEDCRDERFLVNDASFDRQVVVDYCRLSGFEPRITLCSNESGVVGAALESGQGVSMVPANVFYEKHDPNGAVALRMTDVEVVRMLTIAYRKDHIFTGEAHRFFQFTKDFFLRYNREIQSFLDDYFPEREYGDRKTLGLNSDSILDKIY